MSTISKYKILTKANDSFNKSEYKNALEQFATVLQSFPNSKEAYNGVILSEMAMSGESGAEALFDYFNPCDYYSKRGFYRLFRQIDRAWF